VSKHGEIDVVYVAGPPGAGKTSVSEGYQAQHPYTEQFGTGELIWGIRDGDVDSQYASMIRDAAQNGTSISDALFSMVVYERITRVKDSTETVMVTGFPHDYSDWRMFNEASGGSGVNAIGSVYLDANLVVSISRMQERDIKKGISPDVVTYSEELLSYEKRYYDLMGRLAIRLDCYRQAGLDIVTISADNSRDQVLSEFDETIRTFKEGKV
jgi:adenylate kinase family enzyme